MPLVPAAPELPALGPIGGRCGSSEISELCLFASNRWRWNPPGLCQGGVWPFHGDPDLDACVQAKSASDTAYNAAVQTKDAIGQKMNEAAGAAQETSDKAGQKASEVNEPLITLVLPF